MLLQPTVLLLLVIPLVLAAFTRNDRVCWRRNCVIRTDAGTFCFEPHDNSNEQDCTDNFLKNLTHVHLTSTIGRSILYYDDESRVIGAAMWAISPTMAGSVFVCMTGQHIDDPTRYRTVCRAAHGDDDMEIAASHTSECVSNQQPQHQHFSNDCFSLSKPAGGDEHKEWYEQPVLAGFFWVLGTLVTLGSIYMWGGSALRIVRYRMSSRVVGGGIVVVQLARSWRRPEPPLFTQQPTIISEQPNTNK